MTISGIRELRGLVGRAGLRPAEWAAITALTVVAVCLTLYDADLARLLPDWIWHMAWLDTSLIRVTPVVVFVLGLALALLICRAEMTTASWSLFLLLAASQANGFALGPVDVFDLAVLGLFLMWVTRLLMAPDTPIHLVTPVTSAAFLLFVVALAHVIVERNLGNFARGMISMSRIVMLTLVVVNLVDTREKLEKAIDMLILVATLSAVAGIVQFFLSFLLGINLTFISPPETAFKPTPIGFVLRASGLCITAQHLSSFLLLTMPFALRRLTDRWTIVDLVAVGLLGAGIMATWNFGAIIAVGVIVLLFPILRWPAASIHIVSAYVLIAAVAYYSGLADYAMAMVQSGVDAGKGVHQRMTLMLLGIDKIDRSIWWGTGATDFANASGNYWGRPVHNAYLQAFTSSASPASSSSSASAWCCSPWRQRRASTRPARTAFCRACSSSCW